MKLQSSTYNVLRNWLNKQSQTQWFILLWLVGFLSLLLIAGAFKMLLQLAY